jgi:hypothetical protein
MNKYYSLREISRARRFVYYVALVLVSAPFIVVYFMFTLLSTLFYRLSKVTYWLPEKIDDFTDLLLDKTAHRLLKKPSRPAGAGATNEKQS